MTRLMNTNMIVTGSDNYHCDKCHQHVPRQVGRDGFVRYFKPNDTVERHLCYKCFWEVYAVLEVLGIEVLFTPELGEPVTPVNIVHVKYISPRSSGGK